MSYSNAAMVMEESDLPKTADDYFNESSKVINMSKEINEIDTLNRQEEGKSISLQELNKEEGKEEGNEEQSDTKPKCLEYGVEDRPAWYITIILGLQVTMAGISAPVSAAFIIFSMVCAEGNDLVLSHLINTSIFMVGVSTFLQVTLGIRLPIIQGSSFSYFIPIMTMMQTERWKCPEKMNLTAEGFNFNMSGMVNPLENFEEPWRPRLAAISGSLALASVLHILIGATGVVGFLMRFIGPLTVIPTVGLIGLMLYNAVNANARFQWGITYGTILFIILFSLFMKNVTVPLCVCGKEKQKRRIPVFRLFSNAITIVVMWTFCVIFTVAGVFPSDPSHPAYRARADAKIEVLSKAAWFFVPYPGQWGPITIDAVTASSMLGAVIGSVIESIGDYHATARICEVAVPPKHAVNRGIFLEGICSLFSGLFGAAHATTSISSVTGFIGYTGNATRISWQLASVVLIVFGIFGKLGAAFATVPQPIIGGLTAVGLGMCFSIAISNVQLIDMQSTRNQMILGLSFVLGVCMPMSFQDYPKSLQTSSYTLDQVIIVLCSNAPLMGGITGFILDNIIPGTRKERGMADTSPTTAKAEYTQGLSYAPYNNRVYTFLSKFKIVKFIPFLPDKDDVEREMLSKLQAS